MTIENKQILNSMRAEMSSEYQSKIANATSSDDVVRIYERLNTYPTLKNEFLDFLTNKVIMSKFYSKVFTNPLKMLHRGELKYGNSIEQLFIKMANKKGFKEHFEGSTSDESDLIGTSKPQGHTKYISKNFKYKYRVTISEEQLRGAFYSQNGLSELITQCLNTLTSGAYFDEFKDMKALISALCKGKQLILDTNTDLPKEVDLTQGTGVTDDVEQFIHKEVVTGYDSNPKLLSEKIKALSERLTFPSQQYNMAKVEQWSRQEDLVFITTPEVKAKLQVEVLADAFNVEMADIKTRTIVVDELPTQAKCSGESTVTSVEPLGLLIDRDFLQVYDTLMTMRKFDNGANLTVNNFLHKQGILAQCFFANAILITK